MSKQLTNNGSSGRKYSPEEIVKRRKERQQNRGNGESIADWSACEAQQVLELIETVARIGVISFGYTRDHGALYIGYFVGGQLEKVYIRPTENLDHSLQAEIESWTEI